MRQIFKSNELVVRVVAVVTLIFKSPAKLTDFAIWSNFFPYRQIPCKKIAISLGLQFSITKFKLMRVTIRQGSSKRRVKQINHLERIVRGGIFFIFFPFILLSLFISFKVFNY